MTNAEEPLPFVEYRNLLAEVYNRTKLRAMSLPPP